MRTRLLLLLALLLAGCGSAAPAPQPLRLAISPSAYPVVNAVTACLPTDDSVAVTIDVVYSSQIDYSQYELYIRLGADRSAGFAAQLATERILLVTNASLGMSTLSAQQAADLLSGRVQNWVQLGGPDTAVLLLLPPASDETLQTFHNNVVRGALSGQALIVSDPATLLQNVAANPGAAGILPAAWATTDGLRSFEYNLSLPVLAFASQTPQGAARSVLACLQSGVGRAILAESYPP